MNCVLVTLLVLGGGGDGVKAVSHQKTFHKASFGAHAGDCGCQTCRPRKFHHTHPRLGMMPQSCYDPPYGCYPGSRHMNRYPAFHGNYYRRPYHYRSTFDYPWHAQMHEPTSMFSYNTEEAVEEVDVNSEQARTTRQPKPRPSTPNAQPIQRRLPERAVEPRKATRPARRAVRTISGEVTVPSVAIPARSVPSRRSFR